MQRPNDGTRPDRDCTVAGKSALICGLGNVGSALVSMVARMPEVSRIILVDPDRYDAANCSTQNIRTIDVGKFKVTAASNQISEIRPADLDIETFPMPIESVPLGVLHSADLIVACVDSRSARQTINECAWRVGRRWVDTAVGGPELISRVSVYEPAATAPCYECPMSDTEDYAALETSYSCTGPTSVPATNAPPELGALTASIAAFEIRLMLREQFEQALIGRQILIDVGHHQHYLGRLTFNPDCRFDHETWEIRKLERSPTDISISQALNLVSGESANTAIRQDGQVFINRVTCLNCGEQSRRSWRLSSRLSPRHRICPSCGGDRKAAGMDTEYELTADRISQAWLDNKLSSLGFRPGDVFSIVGSRDLTHFELGGTR